MTCGARRRANLGAAARGRVMGRAFRDRGGRACPAAPGRPGGRPGSRLRLGADGDQPGTVRVEWLAARAGWSRKRLWSRIGSQIGLTSKRSARLICFDQRGPPDQSHLHRDVTTFARVTPTAVAAAPWLAVDDIACLPRSRAVGHGSGELVLALPHRRAPGGACPGMCGLPAAISAGWGTIPMEDAVNKPTAGRDGRIVVAGAGYAGLHVALRLTARLRHNPMLELTLVDRHDYHQAITELPRVAGGTRAADAVRIPLQDLLATRVRFVQTEISGFDLSGRRMLTGAGPIGWGRLVLALGSRPNDFAIPGLAQRALSVYSASDAERVWAAVSKALDDAAAAADPERQRRLATVVVGGGGATGVELAGELAEILPEVAGGHGLAPDRPSVQLIEAGPAILAGSSPQLIDKATRILSDLGVQVRTHATIAAATEKGFRLRDGQLVEGGVFVWAGGVKAPELVAGSGLPTGHNGRVKVDRYLRVLDHPEIYVAGDLASVTDPRTGHVLPPLAQVALEEGETVARNLDAEQEGGPLEAFTFHDKGFVVSVGTRRGVADIAGITTGGFRPSGSTASPSGTCAAGTQQPGNRGPSCCERQRNWRPGSVPLAAAGLEPAALPGGNMEAGVWPEGPPRWTGPSD